jgi:Carboxypeptidase regulatory-like domain
MAASGNASLIVMLSVLCLRPVPSAAQVGAGGLVGTVTDQNGALVPGAVVTVTSLGTESPRSMVTGEDGSYALPSLAPGAYLCR